jgi:hypothetical protein
MGIVCSVEHLPSKTRLTQRTLFYDRLGTLYINIAVKVKLGKAVTYGGVAEETAYIAGRFHRHEPPGDIG